MAKIKRLIVNPWSKVSSAKPKRRKRTKNPGALAILGATNARKGNNETMKAKKKKSPAKKRNPFFAKARTQKRTKTHRRRRNPSIAGKGVSLLSSGLMVLLGLVITRQVPQMVLKDKNTGLIGYGANLATLLAAAAAASKVAGRHNGELVGIGGAAYLANRLLNEYMSPIGRALSLSGTGDPLAASSAQLRGIEPAYFPTPVTYDDAGNPQVPAFLDSHIRSVAAAAVPAPPAAKMAGARLGIAA